MINFNQTKLNRFIEDIKDVKIQGATAIAEATVNILLQLITSAPPPSKPSDWHQLIKLAKQLSSVRPTEPMANNITHWIIFELKKRYTKEVQKRGDWELIVDKINQERKYLLKEVEAKLVQIGERLVCSGDNIFTHCHSSLAENILISAKKKAKKFKVYHTETRPLYQGRITHRHLKLAKVDAVMVVDASAAWLVSNKSGDDIDISWVLLGADSLSLDGSVINKIGSFSIALSAFDSGIPVYIASPLWKLDVEGNSRIELRMQEELWPEAPSGSKIINYAFDRVPAKFIKGIITEFGIIKPKDISAIAKKNYPWLFKRAKN